jgi:hypothetical protein
MTTNVDKPSTQLEQKKQKLIEQRKKEGTYKEPLTKKDIEKIVQDAYKKHDRF